MGAYLLTVGMADLLYREDYLWHDSAWRRGWVCVTAAAAATCSFTVSTLVLSLAALGRVLAVTPRAGFTLLTARVVSVAAWGVGLVAAGLPVLVSTSPEQYYGTSSLCMPLPSGENASRFHLYFAVMVVPQMLSLGVLSALTVLMYRSIPAGQHGLRELREPSHCVLLSQRILLTILCHLVCGCVICVLGLLVLKGERLSPDFQVVATILLIPFPAATNSGLYLLSLQSETRQREKRQRVRTMLTAMLKGPVPRAAD